MLCWEPNGWGEGGHSRGRVQQQKRPCHPRSGAYGSPDGFKSVCAGGPEATGRGVEGEEVRELGRGQVI